MISAAVLVPIINYSPTCKTVLFTQRSQLVTTHKGQISFPGGVVDSKDNSFEETALREAQEEIGLKAEFVTILHNLPRIKTRTGYEVCPILGLVTPQAEFVLQKREVESIFEVPLDLILDKTNYLPKQRKINNTYYEDKTILYKNYEIWGATATIALSLAQLDKALLQRII